MEEEAKALDSSELERTLICMQDRRDAPDVAVPEEVDYDGQRQ